MRIVFTVLVPSNSGLRYVAEQGLDLLKSEAGGKPLFTVSVRGEEIPRRVREDAGIGITGEDLLESYGAEWFDIRRLGLRYKGPYAGSLFGLPALCLIGKNGKSIDSWRKKARSLVQKTINSRLFDFGELPNLGGRRVAIPWRYERLIQSRIRQIDVSWVPLERKVDITAAIDRSIDYAVDIVLSGETCEKNDLGIYDVLFMSDGVVLKSHSIKSHLP